LVYRLLSIFYKEEEDKPNNRVYYTMLVPIIMYFYYIYMYITSQLPQQTLVSNLERDTDIASDYNKPKSYISSNESLMSEPYPISSSSY
jgi:hypothetical protein